MKQKIEAFLDLVRQRNGHEPEFMQAVEEVAETVIPYIVNNKIYHGKNKSPIAIIFNLKIFIF